MGPDLDLDTVSPQGSVVLRVLCVPRPEGLALLGLRVSATLRALMPWNLYRSYREAEDAAYRREHPEEFDDEDDEDDEDDVPEYPDDEDDVPGYPDQEDDDDDEA